MRDACDVREEIRKYPPSGTFISGVWAGSLIGLLAKQHVFCLRSGDATSHCLIMDCSLDTSSWETIQKHTLIQTGPRDVFYYREAFLKPLTDIIGKVTDSLLSFGPLGKPWEWWLTFGALKFGKVDHLFRVRSAAKSQFVVKVHWTPPFVSNQHIADMLSNHCKVIIYSKEYCVADGFQKCATGVRQIMCEGNKNTMPYTLNIVCPFTGEPFKILLTIFGRKSICLRCRMEGHIRRDCNTQSCRHCNVFGHSSESYASKPTRGGRARSYANAAGKFCHLVRWAGHGNGG